MRAADWVPAVTGTRLTSRFHGIDLDSPIVDLRAIGQRNRRSRKQCRRLKSCHFPLDPFGNCDAPRNLRPTTLPPATAT